MESKCSFWRRCSKSSKIKALADFLIIFYSFSFYHLSIVTIHKQFFYILIYNNWDLFAFIKFLTMRIKLAYIEGTGTDKAPNCAQGWRD